MTTEPIPPTDDDLERLRAENEELKAKLAAPAVESRHRARRVIAAILAFVTGLLLVTSLLSVWTNRTALNTGVFVDRVAPIIDEPAVQELIAREVTTQLFDALDVEQRLETAVPEQLTFLAGPLTSGVQDFTQKQVVKLVGSDAFERVWRQALTLSHQELVDTLEGDNPAIQVNEGQLVINVLPVVNEVLQNLQEQLPTIFGRSVTLPELDEATLDQILAQVEQRLGVELPPDFGQVVLGSADDLQTAQTGIQTFKVSVVLLLILTLATLIIAVVVSVDRRRTVLQIALWTAGLSLLVFVVVRSVLRGQVSSVPDELTQQAVRDALIVLLSTLKRNITLMFWIGLVVALVLYLAGPGRFPHWLRGLVGQGAAAAGDDRVTAFVHANLDPLRIGGAAVAVLLWFLSPSWTTFLVLGVLLVGYELGVTAVARKGAAVPAVGAAPPQ
ncbi:MAG: hypothetical protein MUC45_04480 [Actinomycetia bacterium]|nr:hypothetical protein [Actinomycetes bacterium]